MGDSPEDFPQPKRVTQARKRLWILGGQDWEGQGLQESEEMLLNFEQSLSYGFQGLHLWHKG